MNEILREAANALDDLSRKQGAPAQIAEELRSLNVALEQQQWIKAEKAKAAAYDDAAALVEKMAHDYMHEHGSYDPSTNSWEIPKHADRIEALEDAVEAIRKRKAEKCHVTQAALVCGCRESYPQLIPGKVSHAPGCPSFVASATPRGDLEKAALLCEQRAATWRREAENCHLGGVAQQRYIERATEAGSLALAIREIPWREAGSPEAATDRHGDSHG